MSWTIRIQRSSEDPPYTKYDVSAYREGVAGELSSDFQLERNTIINDFQKLLPDISGERRRFRSLQKLADLEEDPLQSILSIGTKMYSVLDSDLKSNLKEATDIHIMTDDLEMPWEIISDDGEEPFSLRYSYGVSPIYRRDKSPIKLNQTGKLKVLFIADTKDDLPQTRFELRSITSMLESNNIKVNYDTFEGKKATYNRVRNYVYLMQNLDIVHVAAHTEFDDSGGWVVLNDGPLRPKDIYKDVMKSPPWLVFMNSCESAKTMASSYIEDYGELIDLASAFLVAGASSYIGTICRISDKAASQIAVKFYDELLKGATVGKSMQTARKGFFNEHLKDKDLSWLAFRLYGDPNSKRDFPEEELKDMEEKVKNYVGEKKKRRQKVTITGVVKEFNIPPDDARRILSRLGLLSV